MKKTVRVTVEQLREVVKEELDRLHEEKKQRPIKLTVEQLKRIVLEEVSKVRKKKLREVLNRKA